METYLLKELDYSKTWYHGSPYKLTTIRKGSTITQDYELAKVFSHKPTLVSISDAGKIKHNGTTPGFLYYISEDIQPGDITPHPTSTIEYGKEWLTVRELHTGLIGPTQIVADESLTEEELDDIIRHRLGRYIRSV